ncbi:MAG: hypothetical protein SangKO_036560 [Sandaracinaceae bacterium]
MGYSTRYLASDIFAVRGSIGSGDEALLAEIEKKSADQIRHVDAWFEGEAPSLREALRELIIDCPVVTEASAYMYWYAVELLCEHHGTDLGSADWRALYGEDPLPTRLAEWTSPLDLPEPPDFPAIAFVGLEQMPAEIERLRPLTRDPALEAALANVEAQNVRVIDVLRLGVGGRALDAGHVIDLMTQAQRLGRDLIGFTY